MHLNGTEWVISSSSSLSSSSLNSSSLSNLDHLFHYRIHPEQAQDQPTTQLNLFLQNHNKKIIISYIVISKISKNIQTAILNIKLQFAHLNNHPQLDKTIHTNN